LGLFWGLGFWLGDWAWGLDLVLVLGLWLWNKK